MWICGYTQSVISSITWKTKWFKVLRLCPLLSLARSLALFHHQQHHWYDNINLKHPKNNRMFIFSLNLTNKSFILHNVNELTKETHGLRCMHTTKTKSLDVMFLYVNIEYVGSYKKSESILCACVCVCCELLWPLCEIVIINSIRWSSNTHNTQREAE